MHFPVGQTREMNYDQGPMWVEYGVSDRRIGRVAARFRLQHPFQSLSIA
jgi:hypothetical protein